MDAVGVRAAQGKVPAAGLASSGVMSNSRFRRFPVTVTQPAVTRCRSGRRTRGGWTAQDRQWPVLGSP
jgi:hypothetical protein